MSVCIEVMLTEDITDSIVTHVSFQEYRLFQIKLS